MPLFHLNRCNLKRRLGLNGHSLCALLVGVVYACGLAGCGDIPTAPPPDPGPLTIVTNSPLPSGTVNQPYASALGGSGGITPYTWSLASGSPALPAGRFLDSTTGTITGTPTAPGTTTPIFRLEDSSSPVQAVQKSLTITITTTPQPLTISTSSLPEGAVNQPYPPTILQATGEIQPYTWSVNPALPNGLQFNVLSPGTISGTPLNGMAGTTTHTFAVSDSDAPFTQRATTQLSLKINPLPLAVEGDLSLSVPVFDSKIILQTRAMFAGAVSSLIFRGKEHLDSHDHGRLLQSASSFDGYGECFNPTEGGASPESQSQNVSVLKAARVEGNQLWTVVDMGFWLNPGQAYPNGCGRRKSLTKAVNTVLTSGHLLEKRVTVGLPGFPNVIEHQVTFYVPANFADGTFEASTGYVPKEFSRALYYDPEHGAEIDPGNQQGEQAFPVILATPDNLYAIGVYSPQLPINGLGYGRFSFPDVNKWNCVFRENNITPRPYNYQCLIILGTLHEVENTLRRLDTTYGHLAH